MQIPLHSYDLIDRLDELFPEVIYAPEQNLETFLLKQGERRLVHWLKGLRRVEQDTREVRAGCAD